MRAFSLVGVFAVLLSCATGGAFGGDGWATAQPRPCDAQSAPRSAPPVKAADPEPTPARIAELLGRDCYFRAPDGSRYVTKIGDAIRKGGKLSETNRKEHGMSKAEADAIERAARQECCRRCGRDCPCGPSCGCDRADAEKSGQRATSPAPTPTPAPTYYYRPAPTYHYAPAPSYGGNCTGGT